MNHLSKLFLLLVIGTSSLLSGCEAECLCGIVTDLRAEVSEASAPVTIDSASHDGTDMLAIDMGTIERSSPQQLVLALESTVPMRALHINEVDVAEGSIGVSAEDISITWKDSSSQTEYLLPMSIFGDELEFFLVISFAASEVGPLQFDLLLEYYGGIESSITVRVEALTQ